MMFRNIKIYKPYQVSLIAVRRIYMYFVPTRNEMARISDADEISELIIRKLNSEEPFVITRFGAVELGCLTNHIGIINDHKNPVKYITGSCPAWWYDEGNRFCMKNNAGFFPNDNDSLFKFGELLLNDIRFIDVLASWLPDEWRFRSFFPDADIISFNGLDPFWSKIPWTKALIGKKVLVVHPFSEEIKYQYYNNRERLHNNPDILPLFSLETIKAVQSIGGSSAFSTWFDALHYMEKEIDKKDYEVCLIGCGAYGMPLAAHVKRHGKQAIHMGGTLQLLFGIRGKRWETSEYGKCFFPDGIGKYPSLMNEYWIRPFKSSIFDGAEKVEGGCYW